MSFRISPQKSAWSWKNKRCWAIDKETKRTTFAGASSRSNYARPRGFRRSASIPKQGTTPPATEFLRRLFSPMRHIFLLFCAAAVFTSAAVAQVPIPNSAPPPPGQCPNAGKQGSSIKVDVNLVVLHTTVIDDRQRFADGLKSENFRIFKDKPEQKLSVF